jgi:MFS superfamily sulfate permease-like transporter
MLAAIAIPGQLATARLAGMLETGLYAFATGSLAFAAFGANRFMSVAADSTNAPIFAGGVASLAVAGSPHYAELVTLLALMVGTILLVVGLLRAGWLATLLSIPVTTGFLAGIAIHIIVGELPTLLGVSQERGHLLVRLFHILGRLGEANPCTLGLGAGVLAITLGTARISSKIPGALIGVVVAGIALALFHLETRGVSLLGALSVELPRFALPSLSEPSDLGQLVPLALVVAMVCNSQTRPSPSASGIVPRLYRPSWNITGFANLEASLEGKWLELLTEIAPGLKRVRLIPSPPDIRVAWKIPRIE